MLSMIAVRAFALFHQPVVAKRPVLELYRAMSAVAAAVRRLPAFQVVRAHGVHAMSGRSPALPQARSAPTPLALQSSLLYMSVRQPRWPAGIVVSPSLLPVAQVRPPSKERSSQTSSAGPPLSIDAQPMASVSSRCRAMRRAKIAVLTGERSVGDSAGSRPSQ